MRKLVTISKMSFIVIMSMVVSIGLWSCDDDDNDAVIFPPAITEISISSGSEGDEVIITGINFSTIAAENVVSFNGISATVNAATGTSISTTVPIGATTGNVTVTIDDLTSNDILFTIIEPGHSNNYFY